MSNSTISNSTYGSYFDLQRRVFLRVKAAGLNAQVLELVQRTFEDAIRTEGADLARGEKEHLLKQIAELLFDEIVNGLESDSKLA